MVCVSAGTYVEKHATVKRVNMDHYTLLTMAHMGCKKGPVRLTVRRCSSDLCSDFNVWLQAEAQPVHIQLFCRCILSVRRV